MASPSILRTAHGKGASALRRAETPPLDELSPLNATDTETGLALRKKRGRPFEKGNRAAAGRGPDLTRMGVNLDTTDDVDRRSALRKAETLRRHRAREMSTMHGGELSSGVHTELASWALAIAFSRLAYDRGDATQGALLAERASAHQLKAVGLAERETKSRPRTRRPAPWLEAADKEGT